LQPPDQLLTKKDVRRRIEPGGRGMDGNRSHDERASYDACPEYIDHLGYTHRQIPLLVLGGGFLQVIDHDRVHRNPATLQPETEM